MPRPPNAPKSVPTASNYGPPPSLGDVGAMGGAPRPMDDPKSDPPPVRRATGTHRGTPKHLMHPNPSLHQPPPSDLPSPWGEFGTRGRTPKTTPCPHGLQTGRSSFTGRHGGGGTPRPPDAPEYDLIAPKSVPPPLWGAAGTHGRTPQPPPAPRIWLTMAWLNLDSISPSSQSNASPLSLNSSTMRRLQSVERRWMLKSSVAFSCACLLRGSSPFTITSLRLSSFTPAIGEGEMGGGVPRSLQRCYRGLRITPCLLKGASSSF